MDWQTYKRVNNTLFLFHTVFSAWFSPDSLFQAETHLLVLHHHRHQDPFLLHATLFFPIISTGIERQRLCLWQSISREEKEAQTGRKRDGREFSTSFYPHPSLPVSHAVKSTFLPVLFLFFSSSFSTSSFFLIWCPHVSYAQRLPKFSFPFSLHEYFFILFRNHPLSSTGSLASYFSRQSQNFSP